MAGNTLGCPHQRDADWICSVLVREVSYATTLSDKHDAAMAILDVRRYVEPMVREWEHLNGLCTSQPYTMEGANLHPPTPQGQNGQSATSPIA